MTCPQQGNASKPVLGYPSKMEAVKALKFQGLDEYQIADMIGIRRRTVLDMISKLRKKDDAFRAAFPPLRPGVPKNSDKCKGIEGPAKPKGYTEKYVDDARVEINSPDTPLSVKWELLYMLGIARDPAAKGVRS